MALVDNVIEFANHLSASLPAETTVQAAHNMAQQIAQHFAFATLDGTDIALGSNLSEPAIQALTARLIVAFVIVDDPEGASSVMEQGILDYLNNGPITDMWPAAVAATKDGPDLDTVMRAATAGTERVGVLARVATARGLTQWINEAVKVELDEVPARYEYVV
jgi:hypothetical protein